VQFRQPVPQLMNVIGLADERVGDEGGVSGNRLCSIGGTSTMRLSHIATESSNRRTVPDAM
jgi:hypothetical protein